MSFVCVLAVLAACTTVTRGTMPDAGASAVERGAPAFDWTRTLSPPALGYESDPKRFLGARPDFLLAELGAPSSLRKEAPAEIWQYRAEQCVLDIFLYEEGDGPAVVYLEARDLEAAPAETGACLGNLLGIAALSDS